MDSTLDIRTHSHADLYLYLRYLALTSAPRTRLPFLRRATSGLPPEWEGPVRDMQRIPQPPGYEDRLRLDGLAATCRDAEDLRRVAADHAGSGGWLEVALQRAASAVTAAESVYREAAEQRSRDLHAAVESVRERLTPVLDDCMRFLVDGLGLPDTGYTVPVTLVWHTPVLGGFTAPGTTDPAHCFVAVQGFDASTRIEMILHEAIHAIDETAGSTSARSVIGRLRTATHQAGVAIGDPRYQLSHAVYFVHAAECVRRNVDPRHIDYGVVHGYYERAGTVASDVRRVWGRHLTGGISADEAVDTLIAQVLPAGDQTDE